MIAIITGSFIENSPCLFEININDEVKDTDIKEQILRVPPFSEVVLIYNKIRITVHTVDIQGQRYLRLPAPGIGLHCAAYALGIANPPQDPIVQQYTPQGGVWLEDVRFWQAMANHHGWNIEVYLQPHPNSQGIVVPIPDPYVNVQADVEKNRQITTKRIMLYAPGVGLMGHYTPLIEPENVERLRFHARLGGFIDSCFRQNSKQQVEKYKKNTEIAEFEKKILRAFYTNNTEVMIRCLNNLGTNLCLYDKDDALSMESFIGHLIESASCKQSLAVQELSEAIRRRNIQVITFTRPNGNEQPMLPSDIFSFFQLLNTSVAPGIEFNVAPYDFAQRLVDIEKRGIQYDIDRYFQTVIGRIRQLDTAKSPLPAPPSKSTEDTSASPDQKETMIDTVKKFLSGRSFESIGDIPKINPERWTILVFQETFFSKTHALNNDIVNLIVEYCNELTRNNPKLIIVVNFLHEFTWHNCPYWVKNYNIETIDIDSCTPPLLKQKKCEQGFVCVEDSTYRMSFYKPQQPRVSGTPPSKPFSLVGKKRLANYSLVICTGTPVAIYRKFFYAAERNPLIEEGYVYEPGNFFLKPVILNNPFASLFASNSFWRLFICADLNIARIQDKESIFPPNDSLLSVIQSNTFALSASQFKAEPRLGHLFPCNKLIIHADAEFGPFVGFLTGSSILAYKPKDIRIKYEEQKVVKLGTDPCQYPLISLDFCKRVHTGIWGCSFGSVHCIMNMWDLSEKPELVELFNRVSQSESSNKSKKSCIFL